MNRLAYPPLPAPGFQAIQAAEVSNIISAFLANSIAGRKFQQAKIAGQQGAFVIVLAIQYRRTGWCQIFRFGHLSLLALVVFPRREL